MGTGDNNRPVTVADLRELREGIRGDIQTSVRTIRQGLRETPPPVATTNIDISTPDRTELFPHPKKEQAATIIQCLYFAFAERKKAASRIQALARSFIQKSRITSLLFGAVMLGVKSPSKRQEVMEMAPWKFNHAAGVIKNLLLKNPKCNLLVLYGNEFASNFNGVGITISCPILHVLVLPTTDAKLRILSGRVSQEERGEEGNVSQMFGMDHWNLVWSETVGFGSRVLILQNQPDDEAFEFAKWANLGEHRYSMSYGALDVEVNFANYLQKALMVNQIFACASSIPSTIASNEWLQSSANVTLVYPRVQLCRLSVMPL